MYEISGVYGFKQLPNGIISRQRSAFKTTLNTEHGVVRFIDEEQPFESISIKDPITKKDLTEYFLGGK